jgi:hypothetical protein
MPEDQAKPGNSNWKIIDSASYRFSFVYSVGLVFPMMETVVPACLHFSEGQTKRAL